MMSNIFLKAVCIVSCLLLGMDAVAATIGIVRDGPNAWYFAAQVDDFKAELAELAEGDYSVTYKEFSGEWDAESTKSAVRAALQDTEIDIVYTAGMAASMVARGLPDEERTKPMFGGAVQYSNVHDYPITAEGQSSVKNFAFIASPQRVAADLELLLRLKKADTIYVFIDGLFLEHLKDVEEITKAFEDSLGATIHFVAGADTVDSYMTDLPEEADVAYVSILGRLDEAKRREFYSELQKRKLVNVAMAGEQELKLGAMASLATDVRKPIARRIALNLHQLIKGAETADLLVYLPVEDRLTINMPAVKAIGWSPDYDTALEGIFIGVGALEGGESLTLVDAMRLAADHNVELAIAETQLATQRASERGAKSILRPNLSLKGEYGRTEIENRISADGPDETHGGNYGVQLTQILFNDAAWSGSKAANASTRAEELAVESARLDAMESAGVSFLQLLLNQALYRIQQENLRLTDNNLRLARLRKSIGAADASEVLRWESSAAQDRAALFQRDGDVRDGLAGLNRVLGTSQAQVWYPKDIELRDESFYFLDEEMNNSVNTYDEFQRYRDYLKVRAIQDAPELKQFDAALEAQGYILKQAKRERFVPEISGSTTWLRVPQGSNLTSDDEQDEWFIGVAASIPLFEGGGVKAKADEERTKLETLEHQRTQALQFIEQETVEVWNGIGSLHPSIRLSRQSRDAAREAYQVVRDRYSQGAATILDILDAQVQLLGQEQQTAQALYSYLINIVRLQRAVSWFEHEHSPEEQQKWADELKQFLNAKETP